MAQNILRPTRTKVSKNENSSLTYEGAPQPYEDPADYLPRGVTIKAVRIG